MGSIPGWGTKIPHAVCLINGFIPGWGTKIPHAVCFINKTIKKKKRVFSSSSLSAI